MQIDINTLNQAELNKLISTAEKRKKEIKKERLAQLRKRVNDLIKAEGYTFEDVFGTRQAPARKTGKVPPKYRDPNDASQTWSGRGKQPRWFKAAIAEGKSRDDMLIK